ncbi:MAG: sigma-70 family RNA polymerase sigma factor [Acidobacteriota bacterium]
MDDATAIQKCREGEREAFRHLVERYQAEAIGHAVSILGNRDDALDAVQEAFIDAFQALVRFDLEQRFYPWFYTLLRNRCFKLAAARKRREATSTDELEILSPLPGVSREDSLSLEQALLALTPEQRELVTLKHLDGLSYEELAAKLHVPVGTIMSRLFHARKKLRERLSRRFASKSAERTI